MSSGKNKAAKKSQTSSQQNPSQAQEQNQTAPGDGDEQSTTQNTPDAPENDQDTGEQGQITQEGADAPEQASGDDSDRRNRPVDQNTANVKWGVRPPEGKPKGKILGPDEEVTFDGDESGNFVTVKEDVYREVYSYSSNRPSYVLLFRAGSQIPLTTVKRINAEAKANSDDNSEENKED